MTRPVQNLRAALDKVAAITKAQQEASAQIRGQVAAQPIEPVATQGVNDGKGSGGGQGLS